MVVVSERVVVKDQSSQSVSQSVSQSFSQSVIQSVSQSVSQSVYNLVGLSFTQSV
jgi:hypothetical protein